MNATTVAVDLAKSVFQLAVADERWRMRTTPTWRRTARAPEVLGQVLGETLPALQQLKQEGLVGAIGLGTNDAEVVLQVQGEAGLDVLMLAGRYPDLRLVIDHAAKPAISAGEWQPWADGIARLASETRAMCKLSGLMTEAGRTPAPGAVRRWAEHVLACFGASRVVWGSDWPVLELSGSYAQWWGETRQLLEYLSAQEQAAIMGGNARRLYRL